MLAHRLAEVRQRIADACTRAGRAAETVRLIAVTKTVGPDALAPLAALGVVDVGENRVGHLTAMRTAAPGGMRFHFIGRVQGRQLAQLAPHCVALHSLADPGHVERLGRAVAGRMAPLDVFVQVNTSGEAAKAGIAPADVPRLLDAVRGTAGATPVGLMTMAPELGAHADADAVRRAFATLRALAERHHLPRLSMGMTLDYELAIAEGATDVRIGSALFA